MTKKCLFLLVFSGFFLACKNEPTDGNYQEVEGSNPAVTTTGSPTEQLVAAAIEESNYTERVRQSFIPLQEEYKKVKGKVPGIGDVTVLVDENFNLLIENKFEGSTFQTKVNLKHLNNKQGGMSLVPNNAAGEFPGLKVFVSEGKPGVEIIKDGKVIREDRQLEIYLADRPGIERITPAILQALNVAQGNIPD